MTSLSASDAIYLRSFLGDISNWQEADRGGFYLAYYDMIKNINPDAAQQVLLQAEITTYSGFIGGAALLGNALAKNADPIQYNIPLDKFSWEIADALCILIEQSVDQGGIDAGVISAGNIQLSDQGFGRKKAFSSISLEITNSGIKISTIFYPQGRSTLRLPASNSSSVRRLGIIRRTIHLISSIRA